MLSYCLKCRENTESKNPKVVKNKNGRIMLLSKCAVCDGKKLKSINPLSTREHWCPGISIIEFYLSNY